MTTQPEALRLAGYLTDCNRLDLTCDEAAAELRRLHRHELVLQCWLDKTDWVQETAQAGELGMHRADVLKKRIEKLEASNQELLASLSGFLECPYDIDPATVPKAGIEAAPMQVVGNMSVALVRIRLARAAIAKATGGAA